MSKTFTDAKLGFLRQYSQDQSQNKTNMIGIMSEIQDCKGFTVSDIHYQGADSIVADIYESLSDKHYELKITPKY